MSDAVRSALERLRLDGALFFRSELTEPFAFESTPLALAEALVPGADRLTLFHIVASGSCWVALDDGVRYSADEGDVIVLPYGDEPPEVILIGEDMATDARLRVHGFGMSARVAAGSRLVVLEQRAWNPHVLSGTVVSGLASS